MVASRRTDGGRCGPLAEDVGGNKRSTFPLPADRQKAVPFLKQQAANQAQDQKQKEQQAAKTSEKQQQQAGETNQQQYAEGQMTPEQARQLLDAQKGDEKMLPPAREGKPADRSKPLRDW